jgi:hypothetical protein
MRGKVKCSHFIVTGHSTEACDCGILPGLPARLGFCSPADPLLEIDGVTRADREDGQDVDGESRQGLDVQPHESYSGKGIRLC